MITRSYYGRPYPRSTGPHPDPMADVTAAGVTGDENHATTYAMQNDQPTYMGQPANRGEIKIEPTYPNEGFATITCGGTTVQIGYTMLHHFAPVWAAVPEDHPDYPKWKAIRDAMHSIICEASIGGKDEVREWLDALKLKAALKALREQIRNGHPVSRTQVGTFDGVPAVLSLDVKPGGALQDPDWDALKT